MIKEDLIKKIEELRMPLGTEYDNLKGIGFKIAADYANALIEMYNSCLDDVIKIIKENE